MHPVRAMTAFSNVIVPVCVSISSLDPATCALSIRHRMLKNAEDEGYLKQGRTSFANFLRRMMCCSGKYLNG